MINTYMKATLGFAAILALPAYAQSIYTATQTAITLKPAQPSFTLKLKSNPTTGYSWSLQQYDAKYISPGKHNYQRPDSKLIGAGGYEYWSFRVKPAAFAKPQTITTIIRMKYARPWEKDKSGAVTEFSVTTAR